MLLLTVAAVQSGSPPPIRTDPSPPSLYRCADGSVTAMQGGCPVPGAPRTHFDIVFSPGSAFLGYAGEARLDEVAENFARLSGQRVIVEDLLDFRASTASLDLAHRRGNAVRDGLIARGVPASALLVTATNTPRPEENGEVSPGLQMPDKIFIRIVPARDRH